MSAANPNPMEKPMVSVLVVANAGGGSLLLRGVAFLLLCRGLRIGGGVWSVVREAMVLHHVGQRSSQSYVQGPQLEASGQKKLKGGQACSGFPQGGGSVVRSASMLLGTV
jgi:hypothetical protein